MAAFASVIAGLLLPGFSVAAIGPAGGMILAGPMPGTLRPGLVYVPPSFDGTNKRYPVVYLLHGLPGSPSEYINGANLLSFADAAITAGVVRPFLAVIPAAGLDHSYGGEWAGRWEINLIDGIVPWADARLPTLPDRSDRVIAGLSAGGYGAVNTALRHPTVFGTVESWSGYFTPLPDPPFTTASRSVLAANDPMRTISQQASTLRKEKTRFFLATGPQHSRLVRPAQTIAFAQKVHQLGINVTSRTYPSPAGQWRLQLSDGLTWALAPSLLAT